MWEFLQTAEGIALVSVTVAGLSLLVTGFSIWLNYRGAEKRQTRQLAHERRQASRAEAAKAYLLAANALREMTWLEIERRVHLGDDAMSPVMAQAAREARDAMELATAYSWNDEVLEAASEVLGKLGRLTTSTSSMYALVLSDQATKYDRQTFDSSRHACRNAIEDFRKAISK